MNKYFYRSIFIVGLIFSAILLAGCATMGGGGGPQPTQSQLNNQQWSLAGRMAMKTGDKGENASLYWLQQGDQYHLRLFGPLGVGAVQLQGTPGNVTLTESNGQVYQATSAEALLQQTVGWQMPVSNLTYWIRGLSAPGYPAQRTYDAARRLQQLQQQGWLINYLSYMTDQTDALPRLIELSRGNINLRIVIDHWQTFN